jgi:hypothetical protein
MLAYLVLSHFTRNRKVDTGGEITSRGLREQYLLFLEEFLEIKWGREEKIGVTAMAHSKDV